jgi:hypothetical protein
LTELHHREKLTFILQDLINDIDRIDERISIEESSPQWWVNMIKIRKLALSEVNIFYNELSKNIGIHHGKG